MPSWHGAQLIQAQSRTHKTHITLLSYQTSNLTNLVLQMSNLGYKNLQSKYAMQLMD